VTLLLFDIDNFKNYNDQYGHGVGDEILRQTAALMRKSCREHDLVARISGDEFRSSSGKNEVHVNHVKHRQTAHGRVSRQFFRSCAVCDGLPQTDQLAGFPSARHRQVKAL